MSSRQKNFGIGNISNITNIHVDSSSDTVFRDIEKSLKEITEIFESEDMKINSLLPKQVLINKTGQREQYKTEKIIRSLLNLGIPLVPTYEIAYATIRKLNDELREISNTSKCFSTKDIRKMVSMSIQECSTTKYSMSDIEKWTNKYARRYGHNNRNVEIYWDRSDRIKELSYDYIANEFLDDVIDDISHGNSIKSELSATDRREMATEILDFINHCDLYRIRYSLLKEMVIEIATQPPHPWMIYNAIRNDILKYDNEALKNNLDKMISVIDSEDGDTIPQSAALEILHHASALVLGMHFYFFGCNDMTAFYQLYEVLKTLRDPSGWNDAIRRSKASGLLADISFSGVDINKFIPLMEQLSISLRENRVASIEFAQDVKQFGDYAVQIYDLGNRGQIERVLASDWSEFTPEEVLAAVKPLLYSIFPCRRYGIRYVKNHFWINYSFVSLPSFERTDFKPCFFVVYSDDAMMDIEFIKLLSSGNAKKNCNTILLITNDTTTSCILKPRISCYLEQHGLCDYYQLVCLVREDLRSLYESKDKVNWFDYYLRCAVELPI